MIYLRNVFGSLMKTKVKIAPFTPHPFMGIWLYLSPPGHGQISLQSWCSHCLHSPSRSLHKPLRCTKMVLAWDTDVFHVTKSTREASALLCPDLWLLRLCSLSSPFLGFPSSPAFSWCSITFYSYILSYLDITSTRTSKPRPYVSSCHPRPFH